MIIVNNEKDTAPLAEPIAETLKKDEILSVLKKHPYYSYKVLNKMYSYGYTNIKTLAYHYGLERDSAKIRDMYTNEINSMVVYNKAFNAYDKIIRKYGIDKGEIDRIVARQRVSLKKVNCTKARVLSLLETSKVNFAVIAAIEGIQLSYVSKIARLYGYNRDDRNTDSIYNLKFLFNYAEGISCEEVTEILPKTTLDDAIRVAKEMGINPPISKSAKAIIADFKKGLTPLKISETRKLDELMIERVLEANGDIVRSKELEEKAIQYLKSKKTSSYTEAARASNYYICFTKDAAIKQGINRAIMIYNGKDRAKIVKLIRKHPEYTYDAIAKLTNKSTHTIWRVAKESGIYRYNNDFSEVNNKKG